MPQIDSELYKRTERDGVRITPHVGGKMLLLPNMPETQPSLNLNTGETSTSVFKGWTVRVIVDENDEWAGCERGGIHKAIHLGDHLWMIATPQYECPELVTA